MLKHVCLILVPFIIICFYIVFMIDPQYINAYQKNNDILKINNNFNSNAQVKEVIYNKVIIVGDSRMYLLNKRGKEIKIPSNFVFIAEPGVKIDWLEENVLEELEYRLSHMDHKYNYHVLYNLGVNDLDDNIDARIHAANYYKIYKDIILKYPTVKFYFLSVNPIDDDLINKSLDQERTSDELESFNEYFISKMVTLKANNVKYCNAYDNINFSGPDGLHYDQETDKKIVNYIVNKCLEYN